MTKKTLILFTELKEVFDTLSDEQAGQLIKAIFEYEQTNILPDLQGLLKIVFIPIRQSIDRNRVKYNNVCEKNKENIGKRWNKNNTKNTSGKIGIIENTKNTDKDKDKDSDKDNDNENNIEERKLKFAHTLEPFKSKYGRDLLNQFYKYWTQPNKSNTKFKQELEKAWELSYRLETWSSREKTNFVKESIQPIPKML